MTNDQTLARRVLPLIDLTLLGDDDSVSDVEDLCDNATTRFGSVAAVCVWPEFINVASRRLNGSEIRVAGVANFPEGKNDSSLALSDTAAIIESGGNEIDVVFPWRSLRDGQTGVGATLVQHVRDVLPDQTVLKVILETGELQDPNLIHQAAIESIAAGADFLKTSTGKTAHSATPEAVRQLFEIVAAEPRQVGVKVSGGVRTLEQAKTYLSIADEILGEPQISPEILRFGASSLLDAVLFALEGSLDPG
jgi:deoxyribose-phosphate aldolase